MPMQILHAGAVPKFQDIEWSGCYQLAPYDIWDGATRWTQGMYQGGLHVVSFQIKKRLPIGRGGMILTDDVDAYNWFKKASHDGRDMKNTHYADNIDMLGWHFYMTPEDAARGLLLMELVPQVNDDTSNQTCYADLRNMAVFRGYV